MWLFDWLYKLLFGLFAGEEKRIVFLGLDNAGKTTLTRFLATGHLESPLPTTDPLINTIIIGSATCKTFDLGGHEGARLLWREYSATADGIVFMVDAADRERLAEARVCIGRLLATDELTGVPMLVLGNKIDRHEALSREDLAYELGLPAREPALGPVPKLYMCSVARAMGYADGFRWLLSRKRSAD